MRIKLKVSNALVRRIGELAEALGLSVSATCDELLEEALADRKGIAKWVVWRIGMLGVHALTGTVEHDDETVYVQVLVTAETVEQIEAQAKGLNRTAASHGAWLLECAVNDNGWLIEWATSNRMKAVKKWWRRSQPTIDPAPE